MKRINLLLLSAGFIWLLAGCSKEDIKIDTEYPVIDISSAGSFPIQCSEIKRGEKFTFMASFSDNFSLGSYSLDIHHNFDHHSHSTEVSECDMETGRAPVKPFLLIRNYDIPENLRSFNGTAEIEVPADIDPGDYHFMIRLTDKEGWQTIRGLSIKIK